MDIPGLSIDGHGYSGIRRYSDMGGRVDIPGLSMDGHSYSGIRGYSDKGGGRIFFWTRFENLVAKRRKINDRVVPIL